MESHRHLSRATPPQVEELFTDYLNESGFPQPGSPAAAKAEALIRAVRAMTAAPSVSDIAELEAELTRVVDSNPARAVALAQRLDNLHATH